MLAIRMQRTGRRGHAQFRMIVQDSRFHPTRGKVVAYVGSYNPHDKTSIIDKEVVSKYLESGAQPSDRVAKLLQKEGVKLPDWVSVSPPKESKTKHPDKLRRNRPAETPAAEPAPKVEAADAEDTPAELPEAEAPAEAAEAASAPAEEAAPAPDEPAEKA